MGWSVVSAVTVATLMVVIQGVATVAATLAGQVRFASDLDCFLFILICLGLTTLDASQTYLPKQKSVPGDSWFVFYSMFAECLSSVSLIKC